MRIIGENFSVVLTVRNGVITAADRPIKWMAGKPLERILNLAERWHWKVEFSDAERLPAAKTTTHTRKSYRSKSTFRARGLGRVDGFGASIAQRPSGFSN